MVPAVQCTPEVGLGTVETPAHRVLCRLAHQLHVIEF